MQIVLLEDIANLGKLGEVVEVANGYARNFLIPFAKAKRATPTSLAEFEEKRAQYEKKQSEVLALAKELFDKINTQTFTVVAKASVDGKLFGSVSSLDIAEAIAKAGVNIKKADVRLPNGPLKTVGEFDINIDLHHDVRAAIKINITAEA